MADALLAHVTANPGHRVEQISKALGYRATDLRHAAKKLHEAGKIRIEGQNRTTQYYPAEGGSGDKVADETEKRGSL
jgi:predicted transcriptional regulator